MTVDIQDLTQCSVHLSEESPEKNGVFVEDHFKKIWEEVGEKEKEEEERAPILEEGPVAAPVLPLVSSFSASAPVSVSTVTALPPEVEMLFEKMAGSMLLLCSSRETETTLFLDAPQFSSSLFYGTRITIREFSTAPKAFNVEIASTPAGLLCVQAHQAGLMAAFHQGNFNFSIGRLEMQLHEDPRPLFQRKDPVSKEEDGREGEQEG